MLTSKKKVAVFGVSVSLPTLSVKVKRPAFLIRRSTTQPDLLPREKEMVSEKKRAVKMVTIQSLVRRTRELGADGDGGEERRRAETWYLG